MSADEEIAKIISITRTLGKIPKEIGPDDDIYDAGFTSILALQFVMDLEDAFSVSFEGRDDDFIKARTARTIHSLIANLR